MNGVKQIYRETYKIPLFNQMWNSLRPLDITTAKSSLVSYTILILHALPFAFKGVCNRWMGILYQYCFCITMRKLRRVKKWMRAMQGKSTALYQSNINEFYFVSLNKTYSTVSMFPSSLDHSKMCVVFYKMS